MVLAAWQPSPCLPEKTSSLLRETGKMEKGRILQASVLLFYSRLKLRTFMSGTCSLEPRRIADCGSTSRWTLSSDAFIERGVGE